MFSSQLRKGFCRFASGMKPELKSVLSVLIYEISRLSSVKRKVYNGSLEPCGEDYLDGGIFIRKPCIARMRLVRIPDAFADRPEYPFGSTELVEFFRATTTSVMCDLIKITL